MPERATVFQFSQVAVESEAGTNPVFPTRVGVNR